MKVLLERRAIIVFRGAEPQLYTQLIIGNVNYHVVRGACLGSS